MASPQTRVECAWCACTDFWPPPSKPDGRAANGLHAAIQSVLAAPFAAVAFALAAAAFGGEASWIDERATTTGQTGIWSEGVAYDPATQIADIDGEAVFTPNAVSAGNYVTLKFTTTLYRVWGDRLPGADVQGAVRIGSNDVFQVWTKGGWLDVAASGIAPVSGAEYNISFVFDYAAGKYSVSIMDAKGVWQLLQSAAGMNAFPIATKAKEVKDVKVDGETLFRSLKGSFTSLGSNHGNWSQTGTRFGPRAEIEAKLVHDWGHAQKLEATWHPIVAAHRNWSQTGTRFGPRTEIGAKLVPDWHRARKLEATWQLFG